MKSGCLCSFKVLRIYCLFKLMKHKKIGRNQPCICGSGKKYKNCCLNKPKERQNCIVVDFGKPTRVDGVGITHDGQIEFVQGERVIKSQKAYYHSFYDRKKGSKIINRLELDCNEIQVNTNTIYSDYDAIFSIDTNTRMINNQKISVSGVVLCKVTREKKGAIAVFGPLQCLEFRNIKSSPEKVAWKKFFELLVQRPLYEQSSSFAVVVDAHLGSIPEYNSRNKPIIQNYFLPSKINLSYASADVGKEYLPNRLISMSDKMATMLLKYIADNDDPRCLVEETDQLFSHFRLWDVK